VFLSVIVPRREVRGALHRETPEAGRSIEVVLRVQCPVRAAVVFLGLLRVADAAVDLVDDGIATGATVKAALASIRKKDPTSTVLAVPVAPLSTLRELEDEADQVVCLQTPHPFYAIGQFYRDFSQTSDEEVIRLLQQNREEMQSP